MKFKVISLVTVFIISGCSILPSTEQMLAEMYNIPSKGTSSFDGTDYIRVSNIRCEYVMFELYQDSKMSGSKNILVEAGVTSIDNIASKSSLQFNIDGEKYVFSSMDFVTDYDRVPLPHGINLNFSHKTFIVPEEVIKKASSAKQFVVRVHLLNNTYLDGQCSELTLDEAREQNKLLNIEITQESVDISNQVSGKNGFNKFAGMMSTLQ